MAKEKGSKGPFLGMGGDSALPGTLARDEGFGKKSAQSRLMLYPSSPHRRKRKGKKRKEIERKEIGSP